MSCSVCDRQAAYVHFVIYCISRGDGSVFYTIGVLRYSYCIITDEIFFIFHVVGKRRKTEMNRFVLALILGVLFVPGGHTFRIARRK